MKFDRSCRDKSLPLLAHPLALTALGLLAANDFLFKRLWPSWITGKLSDFAWLALVPLLVTAALSVFLPPTRSRRLPDWCMAAALAVTGLVFGLVKSIPAVNELATRSLGAVFAPFGAHPALTLDPTDLLALPALLIPAGLWWLAPIHSRQTASSRLTGYRRGLLVLPVAAFFLLADAAAPDMGFTCFAAGPDGSVIASTGYAQSVSSDGGLTWQPYEQTGQINCNVPFAAVDGWVTVDGASPAQKFRYQPDRVIEVSSDGGQTWQAGYPLAPVSEPQRYYMLKTGSGNPLYRPGPIDAFADPRSGNMLFAMGLQGALVHTPTGAWVWSSGGNYARAGIFPDAAAFGALLGGTALLALWLALLIFATLALRWTRHPLRIVVLVIAWLGWLVVNLVLPPSISTGYGATASALGLLALGVLILPLVIEQTARLTRRAPRRIVPMLAVALGAGLLYFLPYVLWLYGVLSSINLPAFIGLGVSAAALTLGFVLTRRKEVGHEGAK